MSYAFADDIADVNATVMTEIGQVAAQFQRGDLVQCVFRQDREVPGSMPSGAREWWLEATAAALADAAPELDEIVLVDGKEYAIARIDPDRSGGDWTRITVRPVR